MNSPLLYHTPLPPEAQKALEQVQRKREYNRSYYHSKVKPKKNNNKQELDSLRARCSQLEQIVVQLQGDTNNSNESLMIQELKEQIQILTDKNLKLTQDNKALQQALDIARQRNYDLMMQKCDTLLPNVQGLSIV